MKILMKKVLAVLGVILLVVGSPCVPDKPIDVSNWDDAGTVVSVKCINGNWSTEFKQN